MKSHYHFKPILFIIFTALIFLNCSPKLNNKTSNVINVSKDSTLVSTPFYNGLNGYANFRIPSIIKTKNTIVAFAEGRKNSSSDYGDIDVVYRRSLDNGKTWEPLNLLYSNNNLVAQNPVPIFDEEKNKIVVLFNTSALSEHDILAKDYAQEEGRRVFTTSSVDNGKTWKTPKEITKDVKKEHWRWYALGPVHGIQLKFGKNKGRLVAPVAISIKKGSEGYAMALIYSDNHGDSWNIGAVDTNLTDDVRSNETTIVELTDGRIYINTRDQYGGSSEKNRGETYSLDGGKTFESPIIESDKFPSPVVQSSLLRWNSIKSDGQNLLFFSTPSNPKKRENLIIMASYDESNTWREFIKVHDGFSAYSDIVKLNKKTLGVLYETHGYSKIQFKRIKIK